MYIFIFINTYLHINIYIYLNGLSKRYYFRASEFSLRMHVGTNGDQRKVRKNTEAAFELKTSVSLLPKRLNLGSVL